MSTAALEEEISRLKWEKEFIQNWLADLLDTMGTLLDREICVRMIEGCGQGCFRRFSFKQDLARQGQGSLEKLLAAYRQNFEVWQDGDQVHIRYGETSPGCYCPAARFRPANADDLHCECARRTHQTIFETALGRPFQAEVVESLRRGGKTCHFVVHLDQGC